MTQKTNFKAHTLKNLHKFLHEGKFAVPKLQRVFVWNGSKAAKLLDSVYRGMPIGSLTVWDTPKGNKHLLRVNTTVLPHFNDANPRVWFLLDGQQRLSVLHRILEGGVVSNGAHVQVDFSKVVFRVTDGEDHPRFDYRKPVPKVWVSITDVLAASWKSKFIGLSKRQLNRVEECRNRLFKYEVPVVSAGMDNIDEARELFIRINSSGTPLGAADRAFARASQFDLRELAAASWEKLPYKFQGLSDEVLLQTRALLDGVQEVGVDAMTKVVNMWDQRIREDEAAIKQFTKKWDSQQAAMGHALDLLSKQFSVLDDGLLPYQNMVSTLTCFFCDHAKQPTKVQLLEIRKWFWGTALGQRYSGSGYRNNILGDVEFFRELAAGKSGRFRLAEPIDPADIRRATYGKRSSISDAYFCLLIKQVPLYLSNSNPMKLEECASAANRKHKHHIFPRKFLLSKGVGKVGLNSILNLCFIPAAENCEFGARPPIKYLESYWDKHHFAKVMTRHLIPHDDDAGLWDASKNGYALFLKQREKLICDAFEAAAGYKIFRRGQT